MTVGCAWVCQSLATLRRSVPTLWIHSNPFISHCRRPPNSKTMAFGSSLAASPFGPWFRVRPLNSVHFHVHSRLWTVGERKGLVQGRSEHYGQECGGRSVWWALLLDVWIWWVQNWLKLEISLGSGLNLNHSNSNPLNKCLILSINFCRDFNFGINSKNPKIFSGFTYGKDFPNPYIGNTHL